MDIGSKLQKVRQDQGISLREIANATKISPHILEALERNDLARLPGGIFARGYLRAYAAELGLDPEQVVAEFRDQVEPPPEERLPDPPTDYVDWGARRRKLGVAAVFVLAAALIIYTAFVVRPADAPAGQDMAGTVATGGELVDAPASTSPAVPTRVNSQQGVRLELQPRGECWVSATVDGRLVVYRLMAAGERATLDARDEVLLRVGDAGAFVYVINGTPGRPLGQPGQPVTIRITKGNYNAWLAGAGTPPSSNELTDAPNPGGAVLHQTPASSPGTTGA
jgi:cytoskeletal protein RodZ